MEEGAKTRNALAEFAMTTEARSCRSWSLALLASRQAFNSSDSMLASVESQVADPSGPELRIHLAIDVSGRCRKR